MGHGSFHNLPCPRAVCDNTHTGAWVLDGSDGLVLVPAVLVSARRRAVLFYSPLLFPPGLAEALPGLFSAPLPAYAGGPGEAAISHFPIPIPPAVSLLQRLPVLP